MSLTNAKMSSLADKIEQKAIVPEVVKEEVVEVKKTPKAKK